MVQPDACQVPPSRIRQLAAVLEQLSGPLLPRSVYRTDTATGNKQFFDQMARSLLEDPTSDQRPAAQFDSMQEQKALRSQSEDVH